MKGFKLLTSGKYKRLIAFVIFAKFTASLVVDFICVGIYNGNAALYLRFSFSATCPLMYKMKPMYRKYFKLAFRRHFICDMQKNKQYRNNFRFHFLFDQPMLYCCHFNPFIIITSYKFEVNLLGYYLPEGSNSVGETVFSMEYLSVQTLKR